MDTEILKTFDENHKQLGVATRSKIHEMGLWHETFHCWLISEIDGEYYLYYQLRSAEKKDYPSLFDITAAGHLLASEEPEDGLRELHEELGLNLTIKELDKLAVIPTIIEKSSIHDREFAHVFLTKKQGGFTHFHLQEEEVAGIVRGKLTDVVDFVEGKASRLPLKGFEILKNGQKNQLELNAQPDNFVHYNDQYMSVLIGLLKKRFL